jgi:hypothetical protein
MLSAPSWRRFVTGFVLAVLAAGPSLVSPSNAGAATDLSGWDMNARLKTAGGSTFNAASLTGASGWSGLTASRTHPGVFWMHVDHPFNNGGARVSAVRLNNGVVEEIRPGSLISTVKVSGATSDNTKNDWEDITVDGSGNIWVFAHNAAKIFSAPEVDPASASSTPLGTTIGAPNGGNSETLFWHGGALYWVNKVDPATTRTRMWKKAMPSGNWAEVGAIAEPAGGFGSTNRICGGDVSADGRRVAIVNKVAVYVYEGTSPEDAVSRPPKWTIRHNEGSLTESLAFVPGTYDLYMGGEEGWLKYLPAAAYSPGTAATTTTTAAPTTTTTMAPTTTTTAPTTTTTTAPTPTTPGTGAATFTPAADARILKKYPSRNYGSSSALMVDGSPEAETLVKFNVSGVSGRVVSARLRLYATNASVNGPKAYPVGSAWSETGVTWYKRPARTGGALADSGTIGTGSYTDWDVTSLVAGDGTYSFSLVPDSADGADFRSREAGSNRPQLVIQLSS